jgi:phosphate transport system protein
VSGRRLTAVEQAIDAELDRAVTTLGTIARAVKRPDPELVREITDAGQALRNASRRTDAELVKLSAHASADQAELRLWLALMQLAQHQGLIANQFELIGEQLAAISPEAADLQRTADQLAEMAMLAGRQLHHALQAFTDGDVAAAEQTELQDDAIDRLNHDVFRATLQLETGGTEHRELAYRHVLIARSLERIGDNAVDIAEQTAFLLTATPRQFTDASTPHKRLIN